MPLGGHATPVQPGQRTADPIVSLPQCRVRKGCRSQGAGLAMPIVHLWGVNLRRPGYTPLRRPGQPVTRRPQAERAHRTGRKRSDVNTSCAERFPCRSDHGRLRGCPEPDGHAAGGAGGTGRRGGPRGRLHRQPHVEPTLPDGGQPHRALLAQRGQSRRAARPSSSATAPGRSTPTTVSDGTGVAGWPYNAGAPVDSSPSVAPIVARRHGLGLHRQPGNATPRRRLPGHHQHRGRPVVRPGDQPRHRPDPALGRRRVPDRRQLRRRLRRRGRSLGQNTVRARRRQRGDAGRVPVVPGGLGLLDRGRRRPLRRRQQRDHQRRRLQRRRGLRADLQQRRAHPHPLERRQRRDPPTPPAGCICQYNTNQNIDRSSPAVGQFLAGGAVGIVIGDGSYYSGRLGLEQGLRHQHRLWPGLERQLNGVTADSPALANVRATDSSTSSKGPPANTIYVLNGTNGAAIWSAATTGPGHRLARHGRPHRRRLPGRHRAHHRRHRHLRRQVGGRGGHVGRPTTGSRTRPWSPTTLTATSASPVPVRRRRHGTASSRTGRSTTPAASGSNVNEAGAWPQFHHDPQLTGDAGTPQPTVEVPCNAPAGGPNGYVLSAIRRRRLQLRQHPVLWLDRAAST